MSENSSNATAETTPAAALANRVEALETEVEGIKSQLAKVLQLLEGSPKTDTSDPAPANPVAAPVPDVAVAVAREPKLRPPPAPGAYQVGTLQFTLPSPSADSIVQALANRRAYGRTGKLNLFEKPSSIAPYPAKHFIPEPAGLFGRIKDSNFRDSHEN